MAGVTVVPATPSENHGEWSFIAMQYYWLIVNRTFEVFVTRTMICGARVRGVIASPEGTEPQQHDPHQYVSARLRRRYDSVNPRPRVLGIASTFSFREVRFARLSSFRENGVWVRYRTPGD